MRKVKDVMTEGVITVSASTPVDEVMELFTRKGITGAPVVDDIGKMVGVLSRSDVARHWYLAGEAVAMGYRSSEAARSYTAGDVMTPFLFSVTPEDDVTKMVDVMLASGIHRMIVTREGIPVGVVTTMDLVRDYRKLIGEPVEA